MKLNAVEFVANAIVFAMFSIGMYFVLQKEICLIRQRFSLRHRLKALRKRTKELSPGMRYIRNSLFVCFKNPPQEKAFVVALAIVYFCVFAIALRNFSIISSVIIACMGTSMPLLFMITKVEMLRKKGSKEGMSVVAELYRHYWIQNKNIYSAMEQTVKGSAQCPVCKNHIYKLLLRLRSTGNPIEMRECIDQFSFSLGTVWGRMLGVCIRLSAEKGIDVSEGLSDISEQLKSANTRAQERRRLNSEASRITVFLVPILYVVTMMISVYYLDVSIWQLIENQFGTAEGFLFFIVISFLFLVNLSILELVQNQKIDY